jgi:cytochrome d ubiquinol oxidase subunit II
MATLWFVVLVGLLAAYAVLDGFDLGVGALHLILARSDAERRTALAAIGPWWDANEVWLLGFGVGTLLAFPRAFAAGFSGFYLPLMFVLWLLMGRGIAIEFRHHIADPLWQAAWDAVFAVSSLLLALLYGVAVGNVVTGVPIDARGYFQGLFGWMLNPYALITGVFSVAVLMLHGAHYLALKTEGPLQERSRRAGRRLWPAVAALAVLLTAATFALRPQLLANYRAAPIWVVLPLAAACGLAAVPAAHRRRHDAAAFLASAGVIGSLIAATAVGAYPYLLRSEPFPERSFTVANAAAAQGGLVTAALWLLPGVVLVLIYQWAAYRVFAGKVRPGADIHY